MKTSKKDSDSRRGAPLNGQLCASWLCFAEALTVNEQKDKITTAINVGISERKPQARQF